MPIHLIHGSDTGSIAEAGTKLYTELTSTSGEFSHEIIEGTADNSDHASDICHQTIGALQTIGLFGESKVVWLKNANFLQDDRTSSSQRTKDAVQELLTCLQNQLSPDVHLLITARSLDKRKTLYKWLSKNAHIQNHQKIDITKDGWEQKVAKLAENHATTLNLTFQPDALELFVQLVGEETRQIRNELEKLALYLHPETQITLHHIRTLVPLSAQGVIWEIGRALEQRNAHRALQLISQQLAHGESPIALLRAAIIPTVRNLFHARLLLDAAPQIPTPKGRWDYKPFQQSLQQLPPEITQALPRKKDGTLNQWGLFQAATKCTQFSLTHLTTALQSCLKADQTLVTSQLDPTITIQRLIVEITTT